jgi:hypothetical protein
VAFETPGPAADLLRWARALGDSQTKTLGLLPYAACEDYAEQSHEDLLLANRRPSIVWVSTALGLRSLSGLVYPLSDRVGTGVARADCTDVPAWSRLDGGWWQRGRRPHDAGRHGHRILHACLVRRLATVRGVVPRLRQLIHDSTSRNVKIPS